MELVPEAQRVFGQLRDFVGRFTVQFAGGEPFVYRPFVWVYLIVAVVMFVLFWPLMSGGQMTDIHWRAIVWFNRWI